MKVEIQLGVFLVAVPVLTVSVWVVTVLQFLPQNSVFVVVQVQSCLSQETVGLQYPHDPERDQPLVNRRWTIEDNENNEFIDKFLPYTKTNCWSGYSIDSTLVTRSWDQQCGAALIKNGYCLYPLIFLFTHWSDHFRFCVCFFTYRRKLQMH